MMTNDDDDDINDDVRVGVLCVKSFACIFGWREEDLIPDLTSRRSSAFN